MKRLGIFFIVLALSTASLVGCDDEPKVPPSWSGPNRIYPVAERSAVDVLFVIDDSAAMAAKQDALLRSFDRLIEGLRVPGETDELPSLHLGVVSTDLGAGDYGLNSCEIAGGKGSKLQNKPLIAGCTAPTGPWISYIDGKTNIKGCGGPAAQCLRDAFHCIAPLGVGGCRFGMPLEAARRALDPTLNMNPGFLRKDALLVVVFLTDEDDCSARRPELFDPQQGLTDPLGPLTTFRCFEFGLQCDVNDRHSVGERSACTPAYDWLYPVSDYQQFFDNLKWSRDQVVMAAITGPPTPVVIGKEGSNPTLEPSCRGHAGEAKPALRIAKVVETFDGQFVPACSPERYGDAFSAISEGIALRGRWCIDRPLVLRDGSIACHEAQAACKMPTCSSGSTCNEATGLCERGGTPTTRRCGSTCLDKLEVTAYADKEGSVSELPKCPARFFRDLTITKEQCGDACPCWRVVPDELCASRYPGAPLRLEFLHRGELLGSTVRFQPELPRAPFAWDSPDVQKATSHCTAP